MARKDIRSYADRREYIIKAVAKRRKKIKEMAVDFKGGACQVCGYSKYIGGLDFHHLDASKKEFEIGQKGYSQAWDKVMIELDKCILVCANCHREIEAGITKPEITYLQSSPMPVN